MPDFSVQKVSDLGRDERLLFERWLGRELSSDETISINAWRPHQAPTGTRLETLRRDIVSQAREIGSRAPEMAPEEIDALVEEAIDSVRGLRG